MALNVGLLRRLRLPGESARATGPRPIRADGTLICSHLQKGEAWTCGIVPPVCPTRVAVLGGTVLTAMERGYLSSVPTPTCRPSSGVPDFALDGDRDRWPAETLARGAQDQPADKRSEDSSAGCRKRAGISAARPSASVLRSGERYTVAWNT